MFKLQMRQGFWEVVSGRKVAVAIKSSECPRVLHETLLIPVVMYGSKILI